MKMTPKLYAQGLLELVEKKDSAQADTIVRQFVEMFARRGQLKLVKQIERALAELIRKREGVTHVHITLPTEDDETVSRLEKSVEKNLGARCTFEVSVRPDIVGGVILQIDDVRVDASVSYQLERLRQSLRS